MHTRHMFPVHLEICFVAVAVGGCLNNGAKEKLQQCGGAAMVFSTNRAFAAVCKDGSVVPWGDSEGMSQPFSFTGPEEGRKCCACTPKCGSRRQLHRRR